MASVSDDKHGGLRAVRIAHKVGYPGSDIPTASEYGSDQTFDLGAAEDWEVVADSLCEVSCIFNCP
jgi:hypothetical protein